MPRLRLTHVAETIDSLAPLLDPEAPTKAGPGEVLVAVHAAGVNPSDVAAGLGRMPQAVWPRTPGRDWAGVVLDGPASLIGQEVFGSGGDLGITRDGSHASRLVLPVDALVQRPGTMTLAEAATLGVPFVTAQEGLRRAGLPKPGDVVLVLAANGKVGQAAVQIAAMLGARVFGAVRQAESFAGPRDVPVTMIDSSAQDVAATVRDATGGHGADIVFNTVGSPYFAAGTAAMAHGATQILIATRDRAVPFDIFAFYRGRHTFVGVDTLALDCRASAAILRGLLPGFASGALHAFPVDPGATYRLDQGQAAYRRVAEGTRERVILRP
jgi:NADPH:quinone reductase-like Zn-dependent oxidoreductase